MQWQFLKNETKPYYIRYAAFVYKVVFNKNGHNGSESFLKWSLNVHYDCVRL